MFENFTPFNITTSSSPGPEVNIHGVRSGTGPPLLLLHGYPQNYRIWHRVASSLAETYTVIAPDLRGYGESSKPASSASDNHITYAKSSMAADMVALMAALGFVSPEAEDISSTPADKTDDKEKDGDDDKSKRKSGTFHICAHDRGARLAHKLLVSYPGLVPKCILLDIAPTAAMYRGTTLAFARAYYHWFFLIQTAPHPERIINADPDAWMALHMTRGAPPPNPTTASAPAPAPAPVEVGTGAEAEAGATAKEAAAFPAFFHPSCLQSYIAQMHSPACVHATCEDYRASATIDISEFDADEEAGRRIPQSTSLMVLWGKRGVVGKCFDPLAEWRKVCSEGVEVVGEGLDCGHYIPEEAPEALEGKIREFLG